MNHLFHLLPQDTRIAELISGFSLILMSVLMMFANIQPTDAMVRFHEAHFWFILSGVFGGLQIFSLIVNDKLEQLRFVLAWVTGTFWSWVAMDSIANGVNPTDIAGLVLGISNLYAFVINLLLVKQSWK